jgi:MFS family permease
MLARLSYATEVAPPELRGRVLSLLGGSNRVGNFVGPLIGGFSAEWLGMESAFYIQAIVAVAAAIVMFMVTSASEGRTVHTGSAPHSFGTVLRDHGGVFATAGVVSITISVLRSSRQAVIPLWGDGIGLSESQIGLIFGLSSGIDMLLFYPVGIIMDRWGRKWAAIPCLVILSAGMMAIPLTGSFVTLLAAGLVTGFGNGLGAGINMTLGADYAPPAIRAEFLGVWRFITDIGTAGGPIALSAVTAAASLGAATVMTGGIGFAGAAIMYFLVAEPLKREPVAIPKAQSP